MSRGWLICILAAALEVGGSAAAPPFSVTTALQVSDPTQMGVITPNAVPSDWSAVKPFPGTTNGQIALHYHSFPVNVGKAPYLQIILDDPNNQLFTSAYLDSYDPTNPSQNYLGDIGNVGDPSGDPGFFQVLAPVNHTVVIVVTQTIFTGAEFGQKFTLSVEAYGDTEYNPPAPPPGAPALVSPADGATEVSLNPSLSWSAGNGATSYDVYFGTSATPPLAGNMTATSYSPAALQPQTKYYWQVASRNTGGTALSPVASFVTQGPGINSGGVSSAAGPILTLARGELATIYGVDFMPPNVNALAQTIPLPPALSGVSVTVGGVTAPMYFVNSTQIDFQVPFEVTGTTAQIVVTANSVASAPATVTLADYAFGVFGYARTANAYDPIIVHLDNSLVTPSSPAAPGETLTIYATGIGKLNNPPASGAASPSPPQLASAVDIPIVSIGASTNGQPAQMAQVLYAGLTPGSVGLAQLNITLPETLAPKDAPLTIQFPGDTSPAVTLYLTPPGAGSTSQQ